VPEDFRTLARQRNRWQRGLLETLWRHRRMCFNPRYGRIGLFSLPYFLFFEALAPIVEFSGYLIFLVAVWKHSLNTPFAILFLYVALLLGTLVSVISVVFQELSGHRYQGLKAWCILLLSSLLENFGYRQLTLVWRIKGTIDWLLGRDHWGRMERKGLEPTQPAAPAP
jgi:cellulose synthase/poly-beta-1,6-N-acetylglucosamine synthase-like glycosyltransferase